MAAEGGMVGEVTEPMGGVDLPSEDDEPLIPVPPEFPSGLAARLTVSQDCVRIITSVFQFVREFDDLLRVSPFAFHSFINELHLRRPHPEPSDEKGEGLPLAILGEVHIGMLRYLLAQEAGSEDFLATVMLDRFTWPEVLKQYLFFHNHLFEFDDSLDDEDGGTKLLKEAVEGFAFGSSGDYFSLSVKTRLFILNSLCERLMTTPAFLRRIQWKFETTPNETECVKCGGEGDLIGCSVCPSSFHLKCCEPALRRHPNEAWTCPPCVERKRFPPWFIRECIPSSSSRLPVPASLLPFINHSLHESNTNSSTTSSSPPVVENEYYLSKNNSPRQYLGTDCGGRSYSACSGFIFVSHPVPTSGGSWVGKNGQSVANSASSTTSSLTNTTASSSSSSSTTEPVTQNASNGSGSSGGSNGDSNGSINSHNSSKNNNQQETRVDCIIGFPHLLCPLIAFLDKHCEQDRAIANALLARFEVFERLLELQFAPSTTKLKGLLIGIPLPRAEGVQELAQSIEVLSGLSMPEVTGKLVNVINTINLINNSAFAKKEGTQDCVVFAPDVYMRDFRPRAAPLMLMAMNLDQNHVGLFFYVNRYPPSKVFTHKALANAHDTLWSANDSLVTNPNRTLAQLFDFLSYGTNMRNRLMKIHEKLPRRVLKTWWCVGKFGHDWGMRARACTLFNDIKTLMLELESGVIYEMIMAPLWLSISDEHRVDANQIIEVIVGGMGQTAEQAVREWNAAEAAAEVKADVGEGGTVEGSAPPVRPVRALIVQEVWRRAVISARTFSRLALLLRVFDSCVMWDLLIKPRGKSSQTIVEASPTLLVTDAAVVVYDPRSLELAMQQKRLGVSNPGLPSAANAAVAVATAAATVLPAGAANASLLLPRPLLTPFGQFDGFGYPLVEPPQGPMTDPLYVQELRKHQQFVVLTQTQKEEELQDGALFQPSYPPVQHVLDEDKVPALWLFADYEARIRATAMLHRNERIAAEQLRMREQERLMMEAQRLQAQERMMQETQRERAKNQEMRNYARLMMEAKAKEDAEEARRRQIEAGQGQALEGDTPVKEPKKSKKAQRELQAAQGGEVEVKEPKVKKPKKEPKEKPPKKEKAAPATPSEPVVPADGLYCLCRTPYNDQEFYVGCDICGGWYHGTCVNIKPAYAEKIKKYKCPKCRPEKKPRAPKTPKSTTETSDEPEATPKAATKTTLTPKAAATPKVKATPKGRKSGKDKAE